VRLRTRDGRSAILKRARSDPEAGASGSESFGIELASLEYLAGMPVPVAPRLLGADVTAGVLASRWPRVLVPAYPALAGADSALAERPQWWAPGR
jgi:hypothetical protein